MNINFEITEQDAIDFARLKLQDAIGELGTIGEIKLIKNDFIDYSIHSNPNIASANKIALIRFVRQIASDIEKGKLQIRRMPNSSADPTIGLADAKQYVEMYKW